VQQWLGTPLGAGHGGPAKPGFHDDTEDRAVAANVGGDHSGVEGHGGDARPVRPPREFAREQDRGELSRRVRLLDAAVCPVQVVEV